MLNTPFSPWPSYSEDEIAAVGEVLRSGKVNYWTGSEGREFEKEYAAALGCRHAIAVANGTVALDLALLALGVGAGDEVIVTSRTFLASVSSIVNCGARPVFADIERDSQNISVDTIRAVLSPRTRAIICVHLAGWPCEMDAIMALAHEHGLKVIEDCAQAHGALYKGRPVGTFGHIGAWSFCQDKIISTGGEGGLVNTDDEALWQRMWSYKDHGKSWDAIYKRQHPPGFRWLHESFGTNWRLTEMQSVLGRMQLQRLPSWQAARLANARAIWQAARACPGLRVPHIPEHIQHACYKCYVFVEPEQLHAGWDRDRIMQAINERGVPCYSGSCSEVYLEKAFDGTDLRPAQRLPVAVELGQTSLMFLVHPTLTAEQVALSCQVLREVMQLAAG